MEITSRSVFWCLAEPLALDVSTAKEEQSKPSTGAPPPDGKAVAPDANEESGPEISTIMSQFKEGPTPEAEKLRSPSGSELPVFEYPPRSSSLDNRTLSTEVLPLSKPSGPIMFGDSVAGYTIAYVFRLQDPRSRGAKRTYALIAMAGRDCRRATKAMVKITEAFESIANRIIALADRVLERESAASQGQSAISGTPLPGTSASSTSSQFLSPQRERTSSTTSAPSFRNITPVSSFLSAKKLDPDGFPRVSRDVMKAKSLIEIVGQENFFVDLHTLFCRLLHSLIKQYG